MNHLLPLLATVIVALPASAQELTSIEQRSKFILQADPQEILNIRSNIQQNAAARYAPIPGDFEPEIPQQVLDLEDLFEISLQPDQQAPKVFLARYQSSAISFVDAYGNPWPIRKISNFLKGLVLIEQAVTAEPVSAEPDAESQGQEGQGSNGFSLHDPQAGSFTMTALKHGVVGNITVYLHGLSTPISIMLVGKPAMFHRAVTLRVADVGPQTNRLELFQNTGVRIGTEEDVDLNNALYGVSPVGSREMVLQGAEGKAWVKGDYLYLQTPIAVFSPEILGSSPGNGKFRAYKLPKTTTVMGTTFEGRTVTLRVMDHPATSIYEQSSLGVGGR